MKWPVSCVPSVLNLVQIRNNFIRQQRTWYTLNGVSLRALVVGLIIQIVNDTLQMVYDMLWTGFNKGGQIFMTYFMKITRFATEHLILCDRLVAIELEVLFVCTQLFGVLYSVDSGTLDM